MSTIVDIVRIMKQMEDVARVAYKSSNLHGQRAKAAEQALRISDIEAQHARATAQFRTLHDVLQRARTQMLIREKHLDRAKTVSALAAPAFEASLSITRMLDGIHNDRHLADIAANATREWSAIMKASELAQQRAFLPVEAHIARLYEFTAMSQASLMRVRPDALASRLGLDALDRKRLVARQSELGNEYHTFIDSLSKDESTIVQLPRPLTELTAAEFVNQVALVVSTSETDVDEEAEEAQHEVTEELAAETTDHLTKLVSALRPELVDLLKGARAAFDARNPDYVRHFTVSLRELFTQVLHTLAPNAQVEDWTTDRQHYHNKRPTRRARVLYVTRNIAPMFGGFVTADVDAVLEFLDAFQKGTHGIRPNFSDEEIIDMRHRMEGLLRLLLVIREARWE